MLVTADSTITYNLASVQQTIRVMTLRSVTAISAGSKYLIKLYDNLHTEGMSLI